MASAKVLCLLVCGLFITSASAQTSAAITPAPTTATNPIPANANLTTVNFTTPAPTPVAVANTTTPVANTTTPVANTTTANTTSVPLPAFLTNNASLQIFRDVSARGLGLLNGIATLDVAGVLSFLAPDAQLILPYTTAPVVSSNITSLLPFVSLIANPAAGTNATIGNVTDLFFYIIDSSNVLTVYEIQAGQLGNIYLTGFWQLENSTTSNNGTAWDVGFASIAPAPSRVFTARTYPTFGATPNITVNSTVNNTQLNSSLPANTTIEQQVIAASNGLLSAIGNSSVNLTNVTNTFLTSTFQLVLPNTTSPVGLNLTTNATFLSFFNTVRAAYNDTSGNFTGQQIVAYKELNTEAAVLTTELYNVPVIGNAYVIQLWQYLNAPTTSSTNATSANTTVANVTSASNITTLQQAQSEPRRWQLAFASLNVAPATGAGTVVDGVPVGAPGPAPATAATAASPTALSATGVPVVANGPTTSTTPVVGNGPTAATTEAPTDTPSPSPTAPAPTA